MKQVNSQSDLISMSRFASPSYLTIRSSVCIILIWDPCIFNLYNLCQTGSNYTLQKPHQCALNFTDQITSAYFLLLQPSIRPVPAQVILRWKRPPQLCIECHLVPLWAFLPKSPGNNIINLVMSKGSLNINFLNLYWKKSWVLKICKISEASD